MAFPFFALVIGAVAMGCSPLFVRLADVGPFASAFWRVALALPALYLWQRYSPEPRMPLDRNVRVAVVLSGIAFAGDLLFWHLAILHTSIANATLLATMAPVWVFLVSFLFLGHRLRKVELLGLAICIAGGALLVRDSFGFSGLRLRGDMEALATSLFFGLYIVAINQARARCGAARVIFLSTVVTTACLLAASLVANEVFWPQSIHGWLVLAGLALISQAAGQGLLTFSLGQLPVAFSSLVVFLEAVAAAALGWIILNEALGLWQWIGGFLVLLGIWWARPRAQVPEKR